MTRLRLGIGIEGEGYGLTTIFNCPLITLLGDKGYAFVGSKRWVSMSR